MFRSHNRILDDIARWQAAGWITPEGAGQIRHDLSSRRSKLGLANVLGTLAAVLIGFAAMSFVAANWHDMPKLTRLFVIFGGLWACLGAGAALRRNNHGALAEAALLAAVAIFGAGIMLIAQMYQMDGHPPDAVLLWGIGALGTGLLTLSNPSLAAALVLFVVWHYMEQFDNFEAIHWGFLLPWAATAAGFAMTRWRPGLQLLCLSLALWIIEIGYIHKPEVARGHLVVTAAGLALIAGSVLAGPAIDRWRQISGQMMVYGIGIAFCGALALQFIVDTHGDYIVFSGAVVLAAIIGGLAWSWRTDNKAALWASYAAFSIEIFSLYVKKIGTLLGTSGFFLMAGLFLAALAYGAYRLHLDTSHEPARAT